MIRLKTLLVESATPQHVEQTNTKEILQFATSRINDHITPGFQSLMKKPVIQYVTALNAQSDLISKYIKYGKSNEAVHLYFATFSDIYFKALASLGSITKFAIRKLISEQDLRNAIKQHRSDINAYYESIFNDTFMKLSDQSNPIEKKWYDNAYAIIFARRDRYIDQLIEAGIKTIYS